MASFEAMELKEDVVFDVGEVTYTSEFLDKLQTETDLFRKLRYFIILQFQYPIQSNLLK